MVSPIDFNQPSLPISPTTESKSTETQKTDNQEDAARLEARPGKTTRPPRRRMSSALLAKEGMVSSRLQEQIQVAQEKKTSPSIPKNLTDNIEDINTDKISSSSLTEDVVELRSKINQKIEEYKKTLSGYKEIINEIKEKLSRG